ncbi:MAG TPA: DoxX family protein [Polyangiaceae bacterium]|jgi:hypothetical protein|nr:DoxX family protein [Polyangiaceae bacterium]
MTTRFAGSEISQSELSTQPKAWLRHAATTARALLGLTFAASGVIGLVQTQHVDGLPPKAADLICAFASAGYFIPLLCVTEAVAGALLLSNRFVPLALTLLAPVIVNIVAFHAFLAPQGIAIAVVIVALEIYLAFINRTSFRGLLSARSV